MTSGGTESLLQAVKTAREVARSERGIPRPQVVCATSAHAALTKAADYFDVDLVRVPVGEDFRADPAAMAEAITDRTVLLVGSAPTYPQGVVDPIEELAALARRHDLLFYVDACMGGYLLPFLTTLGRFDQPFDFRVEGAPPCRPTFTSTATPPRGSRWSSTGPPSWPATRSSPPTTGSAASTPPPPSPAPGRPGPSPPPGPRSCTSAWTATCA